MKEVKWDIAISIDSTKNKPRKVHVVKVDLFNVMTFIAIAWVI